MAFLFIRIRYLTEYYFYAKIADYRLILFHNDAFVTKIRSQRLYCFPYFSLDFVVNTCLSECIDDPLEAVYTMV